MTQDIQTGTRSDIAPGTFDTIVPLASQSLFWRAHYLAPSPMLEALPLLFWLGEALRPRIGVTLGLEDPVAWFALCQSVQKLGLDAMCFGVDPQADDLSAVTRRTSEHYTEFAQILQMDHGPAAELLEDGGIDLLIVTCPATMEMQDEIDAHWLPRVSDGGAILFLAGGEDLGPYIDRIAQGGHFRLDHDKGFHLALRGSRHDDRVERLCRLRVGKPGYPVVRNVFMRMGELHSQTVRLESGEAEAGGTSHADQTAADNRIAALKERLDTATRDLETRERERAEAARKIATLENDLRVARTQATEQSAALEQATARLEKAETARRDLTDRAEASERQTEERLKDIATLGLELQTREEELRVARDERDTARGERDAIRSECEEARQRVQDLETSSSWRITSPLRRASMMVRRG